MASPTTGPTSVNKVAPAMTLAAILSILIKSLVTSRAKGEPVGSSCHGRTKVAGAGMRHRFRDRKDAANSRVSQF